MVAVIVGCIGAFRFLGSPGFTVVRVNRNAVTMLTAVGDYRIRDSDWLDRVSVSQSAGEVLLVVRRREAQIQIAPPVDAPPIPIRIQSGITKSLPAKSTWRVEIDEDARTVRYLSGAYEYVFECSHPSGTSVSREYWHVDGVPWSSMCHQVDE